MGDDCASSPVMGAGESCVSRSGDWVSSSVPMVGAAIQKLMN